jgi:hypothetical protein
MPPAQSIPLLAGFHAFLLALWNSRNTGNEQTDAHSIHIGNLHDRLELQGH